MKPLHLTLITAFCAFSTCSQDTRQVFPDEFRPYVEAFFEDAQARGYDLLLEDYDLTISFRDLDTEERWAYCFNGNRHKIRIDESKWMRLNDQKKRWLIYHELGHCILDLPHRTLKSPTGLCYSVMNDNGALDCQWGIYSSLWWKYYVDELFDASLTPEEYQPPRPFREVPREDRLSLVDLRDTLVEQRILLEDYIAAAPAENFSFTVRKTVAEGGSTTLGIRVGEITFQYCDCTAGTISIYGRNKQFYDTSDPFENPVTLTIQRVDELLYFYANDRYIHTLEAVPLEGERFFGVNTGQRFDDAGPYPRFDVEIYAW